MITILYGYLNIKQCACNTRDWCLILGWEDPNFYLIYNALHVNNIVLVVFFVNLLSQLIGKGSLNKKDHPTCQHWGVIPTC